MTDVLKPAGLAKVVFCYSTPDGKPTVAVRIVREADVQQIVALLNELGE